MKRNGTRKFPELNQRDKRLKRRERSGGSASSSNILTYGMKRHQQICGVVVFSVRDARGLMMITVSSRKRSQTVGWRGARGVSVSWTRIGLRHAGLSSALSEVQVPFDLPVHLFLVLAEIGVGQERVEGVERQPGDELAVETG